MSVILPWGTSYGTTRSVARWPLYLTHLLLNFVPLTQATPHVHLCNSVMVSSLEGSFTPGPTVDRPPVIGGNSIYYSFDDPPE